MAATLIVALNGCAASSSRPSVARPSGQTLVSIISAGKIDGTPWQSEVVSQKGQLCTQAVVGYRIMSTDCGSSLPYPVNFEVEGNNTILFVDGIVGPQVHNLMSITATSPEGVPVAVKQVGDNTGVRYFGYATRPNDAIGLKAFDATGKQIYDDKDKIRSTWQSRPSPATS